MTSILVDGVPVDYSGLPDEYRDTVRLYLEHKINPGAGWVYILSNRLDAVIMCDDGTVADLPQIYRWLVNHSPSLAWGSIENVRAWLQK